MWQENTRESVVWQEIMRGKHNVARKTHRGSVMWQELHEGSIMWQENTRGKCDVAGVTQGKHNVAGNCKR